LSFERALANRAQRLAELEMLVGRTLSRETEETSDTSESTNTPADGSKDDAPGQAKPEEGAPKP